MKRRNEIHKLKSDPLITTLNALNERVALVTYLSLSTSVKEAELRTLVKRQVLLRTEVFRQNTAKIFFTDKGKQKSSTKLLEELANVIQNTPVSVTEKIKLPRKIFSNFMLSLTSPHIWLELKYFIVFRIKMVFISGTREQYILTEGRCSGSTIQLLKRSAFSVLKT